MEEVVEKIEEFLPIVEDIEELLRPRFRNEIIEPETPVPTVVTMPLPHEIYGEDDIPDNWNWGDVDGVNYLSWTRN